MIKSIIVILVICLFTASTSGKEIDGIYYNTYGIINEYEQKSNLIRYKLSTKNLIWSSLLIGTLFVPYVLVGFYLYEPVETKKIKVQKDIETNDWR